MHFLPPWPDTTPCLPGVSYCWRAWRHQFGENTRSDRSSLGKDECKQVWLYFFWSITWNDHREWWSIRASVYFKYMYCRIQHFYFLAHTLETEVAHLIKKYVQRSLLVLIKDRLCVGGHPVLPLPNSTQVSFLVAISHGVEAPWVNQEVQSSHKEVDLVPRSPYKIKFLQILLLVCITLVCSRVNLLNLDFANSVL